MLVARTPSCLVVEARSSLSIFARFASSAPGLPWKSGFQDCVPSLKSAMMGFSIPQVRLRMTKKGRPPCCSSRRYWGTSFRQRGSFLAFFKKSSSTL